LLKKMDGLYGKLGCISSGGANPAEIVQEACATVG